MASENRIPSRSEVRKEYTWDLSALYKNDEAWAADLSYFQSSIDEALQFSGKLGESAEMLLACLQLQNKIELLDEKLGYYAFLKKDEDAGSGENQERMGKYMSVSTKVSAALSFITPEIQAIPVNKMDAFLSSGVLDDFSIYLNKLLRFRPHILGKNEEKLIALQSEANQTAQKTFGALTDVDLDFGEIDGKPLSQSTFSIFMISPDRKLREKAYTQFYEQFEKHKNTLASLYAGSVHLDVYKSGIRNYESSRAMALFPDKVPESVYDNLVSCVNSNLHSLHEYYRLRAKILKIDRLRHYDVYVPIISDIKVTHTYEQAVEKVMKALSPLGDEYCSVLKKGLLGRWVDRYENKGKRSGAYSAGSYTGEPYILLNYKDDVLRDVYTLAHEGGHSMHSWYSIRNNPFQHYNYTIFEAEVASTFNEQLLFYYMMQETDDKKLQAYLVNKQIDDFLATIYRQTMFAEFEDISHKMTESGDVLTVESIRRAYRKLLEKYFGNEVELLDVSDLECLRIPHFYRAFYVYKYATGLSAAVALSTMVLNGGKTERDAYLSFLKSGGSEYPLDSLKKAGIDMSSPEPVENALKVFHGLVDKLMELV